MNIFEEKCVDILEVIISVDIKNTRKDAICIAKKLRNKLKGKTNIDISIYERVVKELEVATDAEYELLKKLIFK